MSTHNSKQLFGTPTIKEEIKTKKKKSELFDQISMMFENPIKFSEQSQFKKSRYFFMINRLFSIKFPIQAQAFNHLKINSAEAVQVWSDVLSNLYTSTPSFIWSALRNVKKKKTSATIHKISQKTLEFYAERHMLSLKQLDEAIEYLGKPFIDELKIMDKELSI